MKPHTLTFEVEDYAHELFILRLASITSMEGVSVSTPELEEQRLVKRETIAELEEQLPF